MTNQSLTLTPTPAVRTLSPRSTRRARLGAAVALAVCGALGIAGAPATASAAPGTGNQQLVIRVKDGANATSVANQFGVKLVDPLVRSRNLWVAEPKNSWRFSTNQSVDRLAQSIARSGNVDYAERYTYDPYGDTRMRAWPYGDSQALSGWLLNWRSQPAAQSLNMSFWQPTGGGIGVAVLDTGASSAQAPNASQVNQGYDYIDDDSDTSEVRQGVDTNGDGTVDGAYGHGTFVAGQVNLVAPGSYVRAYRVLDSDGVGNPYVIAEAVNDAVDEGVSVINLSFGSETGRSSRILDTAVARAAQRGVVVVAAAGNRGTSQAQYPGNADNVLSVACGDPKTKQLAGFSNYGSWVDVAAPCEDMYGALPGIANAQWSGTSLAAPLVSGQAAIIKMRHKDLSSYAIVRAIKGTSNGPTSPQIDGGMINIVKSVDDAPNYR